MAEDWNIEDVTLVPNPVSVKEQITITVEVNPAPIVLVALDGSEIVTLADDYITTIGG